MDVGVTTYQRCIARETRIPGAIRDGKHERTVRVLPMFRRGLLDNGYGELPIMSAHVVAIDSLPPIHNDPFDRVLLAQATVEGITLVTTDYLLAQYPGPVRTV